MSLEKPKPPAQADGETHQWITSIERGFSYQAAAARCQDVSAQLVRLAELLRCTRPDPAAPECPLSKCAMVKCIIQGRRLRGSFFDALLFADPAWDILLELYLAKLEQRRTTVSNLCVAASVPASTALRHITSLEQRDMIVRTPSHLDQREVCVDLTDPTFESMRQYFDRFLELLSAASGR